MSDKPTSFTTSRGIVVPLQPISQWVFESLRRKFVLPERPTYEVKTLTGIQHIPHDEKSIEQTPDDKPKWDAWLQEHNAAVRVYDEQAIRAYVLFGTALPPPDDGWEKRHALCGLDVPSDPEERRLYYMRTEVLVTLDDVTGLLDALRDLMGVPREDVNKTKDSFPDSVQRTETAGPADQTQSVAQRGNRRRAKRGA